MAEVTFRVPSRTVQYGYVELPLKVEGDPSPEALASMYVSWIYAFQKEEEATVERIKKGVAAPVSASQEAPEEKAKELLNEGLGGVTELPEYKVGDTVTVGGIEFTKHSEVPWDQKVDAKKKPWETETGAALKAVTEDW